MNDVPRSTSNHSNPMTASASGTRNIALQDHCIKSIDLFDGTREVTIAHAGETYRLRLTSQNKLILTK